MRKLVVVILPMIFVACLFGSSKIVNYERTLGTVDGRIITVAQLDSVSKLMMKNEGEKQNPQDLKSAALDSVVMQKLIEIRIDSVAEELNKDWEFTRKKERNIGETAKKILYQEKISAAAKVDSSEIAEYYENNKNDFNVPEQAWAKHILIRRPDPDTAGVESEDERQKRIDEADRFAKDRAGAVLDKALAGDDWDSLAATYSEDKQNASKGGDLGFFYRGRMVPEFDSVAFSTPPGEIVGPVSTKFGYHVIKVEEYKSASIKPLDADVTSQIRGILAREKEKEIATAYVDSLKESGTFEFNNDVLGSNDSSFSAGTWVMAANGTDTLFYDVYADAMPRFKKWKKVDTLSMENKMEMLDYMKTNLLLMHAVKAEGYMDKPQVVKANEDYVNREARQKVINIMKDLEYEPTEEEIESYFYEHIDDYKVERKLMVYHIIFQDSAFAGAIRDSILLGADFVEMAKRYYPGEPEIREVAYNLDYIGPKDMGEVFYNAANDLDIGDISHPVKTEWGYHLIKLMQRKEDRTIAQVKPGIKHTLKNLRDAEKKRRLFEEWKSIAAIEIDDKLLGRYDPFFSR
ncbi:MAG: peptidylprolyl isomerase [Candidatus Zixiibacteriota bacterium]|nr:MAG: peptidylprolyl isomerase [candidate division Zixibacteria bacterium]